MRKVIGVMAILALVLSAALFRSPAEPRAADAATGASDGAAATIAALQTRVAQQQREISTLQTRVAKYEGPSGSSSVDAPTPTTTASAHSALSLNGSGTTTTETFAVSGNWDLQWSYDCSAFFGGTGIFQVYVYDAGGSLSFQNLPVNQMGPSGSGVEHYHSGGSFYLVVNSVCSWSIIAG